MQFSDFVAGANVCLTLLMCWLVSRLIDLDDPRLNGGWRWHLAALSAVALLLAVLRLVESINAGP